MFRDVRYRGLAHRLGKEGQVRFPVVHALRLVVGFLAATVLIARAHASGITLSPQATVALDKIYSGDPDAAVAMAHDMEQAQPDHPLGYLIEGEAKWWKRYCAACEIKYGILEAWKHTKSDDDAAYLALTGKVTTLAEAQLAKSDTAEMHTFAGLGLALQVRVYALRGENRAAARAGVSARAEMLTALKLDPQMADATAALGIYNYYVDTLSPLVKLLRIFMGIPGGDKQLGIKQMEIGMNQGSFLAVDIRFILARSLRTYDQKYEQALSDAEPLVARYPRNPIFLLLLGNLNAELGRNAKASDYFHWAQNSAIPDSLCSTRVNELAGQFLASIHTSH
jgi:tetratricopeptide (TPR) repeat protein